ncbi:MAG: metallophosphoesterase [Candidatus Aenigmarchaeota archaeon]|nr:metallophosphoesterase [Candidatus Aenigmarchaeota archaeon]
MSVETKYGFISDAHTMEEKVPKAIDMLKKEGINYLVLNGDLSDSGMTPEESQNYLASVLEAAGKSKIPTYVLPGNHETTVIYGSAMKEALKKYSNIHDALLEPKLTEKDHEIVFLPGADVGSGSGYYLVDRPGAGSGYVPIMAKLAEAGDEESPREEGNKKETKKKGKAGEKEGEGETAEKVVMVDLMHVSNMDDLRRLVTDPSKTIVVSHIPPKFTASTSVDYAAYGKAEKSFEVWAVQYKDMAIEYVAIDSAEGASKTAEKLKKAGAEAVQPMYAIEKGSVCSKEMAAELKSLGAPMSIDYGNVGSEALAKIYKELGIKKAVNGHIHESAGHANDLYEKPVPENTFVDSLFYNAGAIVEGQAGILKVSGDKVAYKNVRV